MRYLEDIDIGELKGKEFWIVGLGPSLDNYPDSFFEGKVTIGLNETFIAFPHLTYFLTGDFGNLPNLMVETDSELVKRTIWVLDLGRSAVQYVNHPRGLAPVTCIGWGKYKDDLIYVTRKLDTNGKTEFFKSLLPPIIKDVMQRKIPCHFIALRTCAHFAIFCAAYLGAKKITLVGCEAKHAEHSFHAQKRGLCEAAVVLSGPRVAKEGTPEKTYSIEQQTGKTPYLTCMRVGTELLAEVFAPYRVEIRKYYYGKGYENLI